MDSIDGRVLWSHNTSLFIWNILVQNQQISKAYTCLLHRAGCWICRFFSTLSLVQFTQFSSVEESVFHRADIHCSRQQIISSRRTAAAASENGARILRARGHMRLGHWGHYTQEQEQTKMYFSFIWCLYMANTCRKRACDYLTIC